MRIIIPDNNSEDDNIRTDIKALLNIVGSKIRTRLRPNIIKPETSFKTLPCHSDRFLLPSVIVNIRTIIARGII